MNAVEASTARGFLACTADVFVDHLLLEGMEPWVLLLKILLLLLLLTDLIKRHADISFALRTEVQKLIRLL